MLRRYIRELNNKKQKITTWVILKYRNRVVGIVYDNGLEQRAKTNKKNIRTKKHNLSKHGDQQPSKNTEY
jgi:hypothetical protein